MPKNTFNSSNQSLTPAVFHTLMALADGEKHGYAIMKAIESQTSGRMKIGPGTLYGSIKRMLGSGLIKETDERPDPEFDDERRRYYCLTNYGLSVLREESKRLARAVEIAQEKNLVAY